MPSYKLNKDFFYKLNRIGESTLFYRSRCSSISMHFYHGRPITLYYFTQAGQPSNCIGDTNDIIESKKKLTTGTCLKLRKVVLGSGGPEKGQMFHATITKNTWFTRLLNKKELQKESLEENNG